MTRYDRPCDLHMEYEDIDVHHPDMDTATAMRARRERSGAMTQRTKCAARGARFAALSGRVGEGTWREHKPDHTRPRAGHVLAV